MVGYRKNWGFFRLCVIFSIRVVPGGWGLCMLKLLSGLLLRGVVVHCERRQEICIYQFASAVFVLSCIGWLRMKTTLHQKEKLLSKSSCSTGADWCYVGNGRSGG